MTSTNDGKDVKSNQTSGPKGKTYYIELYKSLDARLSGDCELHERTRHLCDAWRRIHSLCQHSAPSTHPHLLSWLQRHTAKTVLQTEWHKSENKDEFHQLLEDAIDDFIKESRTAASGRDGIGLPWETQLVQRGEWFQRILANPWGHPTLRVLLDSEAEPPSDKKILEWLKDERCVMFVTRLRQLAADKHCVDLALVLVSAVMDRVRASHKLDPEAAEDIDAKDKTNPENAEPTFVEVLKAEAGFTVDVWELLTDIEFVLLHKRDKRSRCIELAKQTPLRDGYQLVERLQSRLETSPREKKLWKNAKDVATLIAQVIITRCMVVPVCAGAARSALYCCARSLARLLAAPRLPAAAAALAAPAATARHLHTLAAAVDAQSTEDMKPFVCELYVRAITAGMNELERLKLKTEKCGEALAGSALLAAWLTQLGALLAGSARVRAECALTAFSLHPSAAMLDRIRAAPPLPPLEIQEPKQEESTSEFGSWASDSRSQTNFVKTSETLNLKQTQHQANVLSTAILTEGEALGLSPELCQDITVLLSGPRLKTLSWDMDREVLLEKCRTYMERTHGGTRALTTELKYLNLDPKDFDHLPVEEDDDTDIYYGIEKGYEHLVEQNHEPEEIWQDADDPDRTASAHSSDMESIVTPRVRRKNKSKKNLIDSDEDLDPLSFVAEAKRTEKKKERPHSKERSKERASAKGKTKVPKDPLATDSDITTEIKKEVTKEKRKGERKKREKKVKTESMSTSLSSLIGMKISQIDDKAEETKVNPLSMTDSDYDSQGKSSINSLNSEGNDMDVLFDGLFSMDELKSPDRYSDKLGLMKNNEVHLTNGAVTINAPLKKINNIQHSRNTSSPLNHSLNSPNSVSNQQHGHPDKLKTVTEDVKKSITRLIQFRRQKALNEQKAFDKAPIINSSPNHQVPNLGKTTNAITKPQMPLHTQISPKPVEVPNIPKVCINKKQSEQLAEIKDEVNYLLNNQNYIHRPVIQFGSQNANIIPSKTLNASALDAQDGYTGHNTLQPKQSAVEEVSSRNSLLNPNKDARNPKSFHDFLQELQKSINAGIDQSKPENVSTKKEMRPINRVTPVLPTGMKGEHKVSPQCAKQIMQQKKMENALNTFSRLSYMHKNNKTDLKLKHIEAVIEHQDQIIKNQQALSNIDQVMQEQKHAKFKYLQTNDLVISRVTKCSTENSQLTKKVEWPRASSTTSLAGEHPVISNMLQKNEPRTMATPKQYENRPKIIPPKYESPTKTVTTKYENEPKNVPVEPRDSTTPAHNRFSALSEKDQNDLLLLLRQQRRQNATQPRYDNSGNYNTQMPQPSPQYPSATSIPLHKYNSAPCHPPMSKIEAPSTSVLASNTKPLQTTGIKVPHVARSTVDVISHPRPMNLAKTDLNCTKNADSTPIKSQKTEVISENVAKIAKTIASNKQTEWESVMNALLSHKTPSRGPNALEMALNKDTFDKNYVENIIRSHRMTQHTSEDSIKPSIVKDQTKISTPNQNINTATHNTANKTTIIRKSAKIISKESKIKVTNSKPQTQNNIQKNSNKLSELRGTPNVIKSLPSEASKKQHQIDKRPSQADYPKRPTGSHKKQFTCAPPQEDDPFISGIPNSDYDLLEELMDDDLRQEIGELSDDDAFNPAEHVPKDSQNVSVVNKDNPSIQHERGVAAAAAIRQQTVIKKSNNTARVTDAPIHDHQIRFANTQSNMNTADYQPQEHVQPSNLVNQLASNVIVTPNCINNVSYDMNRQLNQTEPAFVATMPQQNTLQKVVLLSSEIVYQPCTIQTQIPMSNLTSNSYMTFNNQPTMAVYQTTRYTAPAVNPVIIGNATIPISVPLRDIQTMAIPKTSEVIHNFIKHETNQNQTIATKSEVSNQVANTEAMPDIPELNATQSQAEDNKCERETDFNKASERKVLSEVQEKFSVNEKSDMMMTRSRKIPLEPDVKKDASKDQERLQKKRMAILNRNIYHQSDIEAIPLTYVPLKPNRERDEEQQINTNSTDKDEERLKLNDEGQEIKTDLTIDNNHQIDNNSSKRDSVAQQGAYDPNRDDKLANALPVGSPENCKENKSDSTQCRRILLRSSNRLSKVKASDVTASDNSSTKTKVRLKPNAEECSEALKETSNDGISHEADQKIVLRKKINKKKVITSKARGKKTQCKSKLDKAQTNSLAKSQETSGSTDNQAPVSTDAKTFTELPQEFDIEEQLMGSKIPRNVSPTERSQVLDEGRPVLETSQCEDVHNSDLINEQPQYNSNNKDIPQEKPESSSKLPNTDQDKVAVASQVTDVPEIAKNINATEDNVKTNDLTAKDTYPKNITSSYTRPNDQVFTPEAPIPQNIGANEVPVPANNGITFNKNSVTNELHALNSNRTRDVNKNRYAPVIKKISDIQSIPQSYKDSIIIEDMPRATSGGDPQKKCVRIKLPSGRIFKATVHGRMNVNFDTLFSDPIIKDILLSNLTDRRKYTLNIKQVATATKNEGDNILKTRVQEVKLHSSATISKKIETINLLSDDEDEELCQYFKTEHGKYKVNVNKDDFTKHQKRFDQKCSVKLKRENLQQNANTDTSNSKQDELPKSNPNVSHQSIQIPAELPLVDTSIPIIEPSNKAIRSPTDTENKPETNNTSITNGPDVIEIDDSSNDSLQLKSDSTKTNPTEDKITELKDLLLKDLGIADVGENVTPEQDLICTEILTPDSNELSDEDLGTSTLGINMKAVQKEVQAIEKLTDDCDKISNKNDLDIVDLGDNVVSAEKEVPSIDNSTHDITNMSNQKYFHTVDLNEDVMVEKVITSALKMTVGANKISEEIVDLTDEPKVDPINSLIQTDTCTGQIIPVPSLPKLQLPDCYIKLIKCDDLVQVYEQRKMINRHCYIKLIRCDQNCVEDAEIIEENNGDDVEGALSRSGSFSILNNFDGLDIDLSEAELLERNTSPVIDVYEAIAALNNGFAAAIQVNELNENNTCKSEWCMTKCELQFQYKQIVNEGYIIYTANDDIEANPDEVICSKSADLFNAPRLLTILLKFFQDNTHIMDEMKPLSSVLKPRSRRLKRKSISLDTGVLSKISKLNESEKSVMKYPCESTDNSVTDNISSLNKYDSTCDNITQDVLKPSIMASVVTDGFVETELDNSQMELNNTSEIETQTEHIDERSVDTVSPNNFVPDKLQEVQHDDEDISIEQNETSSCCSEDKSTAVLQNSAEITQEINDVECVNIENPEDGDDDMKITSNDITNKSEVQNETSTTKDNIALVDSNAITLTIEIEEPIHDCTELYVTEKSSNDKEFTNDTTADVERNEQSDPPTEVITAMEVNQDSLKSNEVQIDIPTAKEHMELLDAIKDPSDTSIDTTTEHIETPGNNKISDHITVDESNGKENSLKTTTTIDQDNIVREIQTEISTTKEDTVLLRENDGLLVTNIDKTTDENTDLLVKMSYDEKEVGTNTAVKECTDKQIRTPIEHPTEVNVALNNNQVDNITETQVKTPLTKEDMLLLDENKSSSAANINKTILEHTEMDIASSDSNIGINIVSNECTSEQNSVHIKHPIDVTTDRDVNQQNLTIVDLEVTNSSADKHQTEDNDNEIVKHTNDSNEEIAEATQSEMPYQNIAGDPIQINNITGGNNKFMTPETNLDGVTEETSNIFEIPNIRDHEYITSIDKLNHLLEPAEDSSDLSSSEEITDIIPTANCHLKIRDDSEMSDGSADILVEVHTDEIYCDPDFFRSGIESRLDIVDTEVHENELTMKTNNQAESNKYQNDSHESVDILDKSGEDDRKPNEEGAQFILTPNLESGILLKGIEYEDPEIGTCYVFPVVTSISESSECDSDANHIEEVNRIIDSGDDELKMIVPKITYSKKHTKHEKKSRKSLKRKTDMSDSKTHAKKYRKGKGIDYPKTTAAAMSETAYTKQFKSLFNYFKTIKFSYSLPFHKDYINVHNVICDWPIQSSCGDAPQSENELDENLFRDVETADECTFPNPKEETTLAEEIVAEYKDTDYSYSDINETNFNMGFGEGSDRVIQNLEGGDDISNFSAATLSDVKQSQPLLLSVSSDNNINTTKDEIEKLQRHHTYMQLRDRVRTFFRKTTVELRYDWMKENKNDRERYDTSTFPFGLNVPEFIEPGPIEAIVQVVQVGQLPVSAAAQNPVTCDPRVTQVANVSPSQCSAEDSSNGDPQSAIKTEYTELTTAELSLPLMQEYAQHHQSMPMESQEASNAPDDNIPIETEIKSDVKIELMEELPEDNPEIHENGENHYENNESQNDMNNIDYSFTDVDTNVNTTTDDSTNIDALFDSAEKQHTPDEFPQRQHNGTSEKTDQIAHAMNAAGITTTSETVPDTTAHALVNILSQKVRQGTATTSPTAANTYPKTSINAMALQQALAQILPPPLNQTNVNENNQHNQNPPVTQQVLHIVQSKNGTGNQITLVDNTQQSVISTPNGTPLLHIVQNKTNSAGPTTNGTSTPQNNTFSGLSLVDAGIQPGGGQLLHIVNTGNQKNPNAGQLLKRVNLLTNLTNVQGSNEQKMVQILCKSADGKAIQLNTPHQRSMVLRLQPIETPNIQAAPTKPVDSQDVTPTPNAANTVPNKETLTPQEIKSRSVYEENYAKFIQNVNASKTTILEKSTSLPKFNQAFGKQVFQDGSQKQNEINGNSLLSSVNNNNDTSECQSTDNNINLEHITQMNSPPLLLRKPPAQTSQAQPNLVQQIKQTIAPVNLQTMHGGVIYTRQIPVNIGGGQTINLITVPSTELIDDSTQKQQNDVKFVNQGEIEPSIIKIVPQATPNPEASNEENNAHMGVPNENPHTPQPQPVLTQMRIKLPMLSKTPQMVSGARVVRPSFFQIQRNVIGGTNQQVYQQLVLTAAPPLGQQTIRLPQTQTSRQVKVPTESQSTTESQMSSSTLEQLREFDLVLEQVKERSTVQPNGNSSGTAFSKLTSPSTDTTDGAAPTSSTSSEMTQQVLYSIGNTQPLNVTYVNRKTTVAAPTTSTYVRSPDSSGIVDTPSSSTHIQLPHTVTRDTPTSATPAQSKPTKPKPKPRPKAASNPPNTLKLNTVPPKTTAQKPLEDELTMQRILYILAEYKEQVENSPDKDKPAPRRRSNPPLNPTGSSKRRKCSSSSRRPGVRDISPIHGEDTCRTMGSEDSSCGTSQGDCNESCLDSHSPQDSPRKVVKKLTFENELPLYHPRPQPQRNLIVADGQTITVARGTAGKPTTAVLMPANYILPVSMVKGGQQIAIVTNRGPKLLTVGGGEGGTTNALLLQRLIGPAGLKPVLTRPGVRHVRLPTAALHNLQAFNLAAAATVQPPDSTASPVSAPTPPELIDTRANSSPWRDRESDVKPERGSSPEDSEPWNLPSSADPHDYTYEETGRTDNMDRTVLDSISDRYSPDMEAQRIFDKMFDVDSKKSYMVDSPRCGYDIDASDCDDKAYHQVVHKKDGSSHRQHRLTHVSAAALRHKYAILEHELRLQKSLSEECEDLGVDSPSASELFPEAELLFAASPAHDHTQDHGHHSHTPQPTYLNQSGIPQPDIDDQIATDELLTRDHLRDDRADLNLGLDDVGIVTVSEDGMQATIALDQEEFARSHPNTTFHSEPTDDGEVHPFTISGIKGRHITSTIFHSNRPAGTVLMTAPQTTVISQATADNNVHSVKYDIDNMINSLPGSHANTINLSSVLVKDDGLTRFDSILNDSRELHLSNTASAIVHSAGNATQVIRRVCYDDDKRDTRFLMDEPEGLIAGDDAKMIAEDSSRDATLESMADVDDDRSSPGHTELFWESNSASERSESRRPLDFSSDSDKCCKSPSFDETNSTDSSGVGTHMRLDTVIKEARGVERSASGDGSSADDTHPPLRTYPPKRLYHSIENNIERSTSGKTRAGERSPEGIEVRRRASGRGVVKRGCHCCSGSPAPPRPKKPRQRKPTLDFTAHN